MLNINIICPQPVFLLIDLIYFKVYFPHKMLLNGLEYSNWIELIRKNGSEFAWIRRNNDQKLHNFGRNVRQISTDILESKRIRETIRELAMQRKTTENAINLEAQKILANMALDLHLHSAVQPIGFILAKIFGKIFTNIWINSGQMENVRKLAKDKAVPIIWLPTHKSYLDFLLISLLCYDQQIQLPAICAAEDFQSSKMIGEALRRCGAFFIRRSFKEDSLYWAIFREYIQQHLMQNDRPIEFFLEGQRSRTGKTVWPRNGLLQLVLEPFLRAQSFDTLLIPVTINYDRILEEELMANELMGFGKPKENASGLLKARRILGQTFGEIFITIGQPISLRQYFLDGKEDIRMELIGIGENEIVEMMNLEAQKMALKIVEIQNDQNILSIWPFLALSILQISNNSSPPFLPIPIEILKIPLNLLLNIFGKLFPNKQIRRISSNLDEDIFHYLQLHNSHFLLNQMANSIEFVQNDGQFSNLFNSLLLSNYSNLAISLLAPIGIFCIVASTKRRQIENISEIDNHQIIFNDYFFLRTLFEREFVANLANIRQEFLEQKNIYEKLDIEECEILEQNLMPFLIGYYLSMKLFLDFSGKNLPQFDLIKRNQEKLIKIVKKWPKFPAQIVSMDLIKNCLNSLKMRGQIQMENGKGIKRMDLEGIERNLKKLEEFIPFNMNIMENSKL